VVVADDQGKFLLFNPAAEQILRIGKTDAPPEEWTQRYGNYLPDMVTPYPAEDLPLARAMRGEVVDQTELFVRHAELPAGIWISVTGRPLRGEDGRLRGGVAVFRDITAAKRAEAEIRKLNEELERRVLERTAELAAANAELLEKNQENELFVYSVSHDLRSPLVNLEGFSRELGSVCQDLRGLLADKHLPPAVCERGLALLDGDMAESIRFIQAGVLRLSGIIDALLRLSRVGRVEYRWQPVDMNAAVGRIVEAMSATIAVRRAIVRVDDLPAVWGDPTAVEQVFANLIGNAVNYLDPSRPGVIEVGCNNAAAPAETNGAGASRTYYVKDNGLGIPDAYRPKVFQAFKRLHPEVAKGEGIGLAVVHRIVKRHGGTISLESAEGEGSTFLVTLPAGPLHGASNGAGCHGAASTAREGATW
jgi:signal transduction histidine kinase